MPELLAQLRINLAKQSRMAGLQEGSAHGGGPRPLPLDLDASEEADKLEAVVIKAARRHGMPFASAKDGHGGVLHCVEYLLTQVPRLASEGGAGVALTMRELERAIDHAWRKVDRKPETWYAGPCPGGRTREGKDDPCGADLLAEPGAAWVKCRACRRRWAVIDRRDALLTAMRDYRARAAWIASVLTPILGRTVTAQSIYVLVSRGWVVAHGSDAQGHPLYRIGDVHDELEKRHIRRMALIADRLRASQPRVPRPRQPG